MRDFNSRRVLLDTNVLLDAVCKERPQSHEACLILQRCNGGGDRGMVAPMSLKDAYYVLGRQYGEEDARRLIRYLMDLVVVAPFGQKERVRSLNSNEPDFEDELIRAYAELNDVDFILTRDAQAFQKSKVRAVSCVEYLEIVK
jgi:predicted nucleic acid-binding protein